VGGCSLLTACPAPCYEFNDKGQVEITAKRLRGVWHLPVDRGPTGDIELSYPRGVYGVLFKFG
jgi:ferredoxin like protein